MTQIFYSLTKQKKSIRLRLDNTIYNIHTYLLNYDDLMKLSNKIII